MKFRYNIVDGNNLFWRAFAISLKKFISESNEYQIFPGAIKESFEKIKKLTEFLAYKDSFFYFLFDNPEININIRKFIDKNYKSNRFSKSAPKGFYNTLNLFIEILKHYSNNYKVLHIDSLEADDLTKPIIEQLHLSSHIKCVVISNDMDWARNLSLSKYCCWYNYDKIIDRKLFYELYEFEPISNKIQLYKAIHGDDSDNIKNSLPFLPKNIVLDILERFNSADDLYKGLYRTNYPDKWKQQIKESEMDIKKNEDLVNFQPIEIDIKDNLWDCKQNVKKLRYFFDVLSLEYEDFMIDKSSNNEIFKKQKIRI